jgi:hypothetical protein
LETNTGTEPAFERPAHRYGSDHYSRVFRHVECGWERFKVGLVPHGLDHPFTLQLLYALKRQGPVSCEPFLNSGEGIHHLFGEILGSSSYSSSFRRSWVGTGKYPAVEFPQDRRSEASLLATGLVEIDHQALTLSLSQVGEKFLNYLHPSCEDPDIIVRWIDANEVFFRPGSEEAISEWLTKIFRKMKTKVNSIPEHLTAHQGRERLSSKLRWEEWD